MYRRRLTDAQGGAKKHLERPRARTCRPVSEETAHVPTANKPRPPCWMVDLRIGTPRPGAAVCRGSSGCEPTGNAPASRGALARHAGSERKRGRSPGSIARLWDSPDPCRRRRPAAVCRPGRGPSGVLRAALGLSAGSGARHHGVRRAHRGGRAAVGTQATTRCGACALRPSRSAAHACGCEASSRACALGAGRPGGFGARARHRARHRSAHGGACCKGRASVDTRGTGTARSRRAATGAAPSWCAGRIRGGWSAWVSGGFVEARQRFCAGRGSTPRNSCALLRRLSDARGMLDQSPTVTHKGWIR